ncbi:MAG: 30S ribosomal protein S8e [Candidatus Aenigmatarchaeota archaeon]|nr:MAG: 30S ribosomal protein S8e [Candidatus Aenigmarchaeota archaeon]
MARWHTRSERKPTGGLLKQNMKRKGRQRGSEFLETRISKRNTKVRRGRGGSGKMKILSEEYVNVSDYKTKTMKKLKILAVEANPANPHYVRRNVLTKGAVVKTEAGNVRITSRPGQCGSLSGVMVNESK